jgi:hypothetical protein
LIEPLIIIRDACTCKCSPLLFGCVQDLSGAQPALDVLATIFGCVAECSESEGEKVLVAYNALETNAKALIYRVLMGFKLGSSIVTKVKDLVADFWCLEQFGYSRIDHRTHASVCSNSLPFRHDRMTNRGTWVLFIC